MACAIRGEGAMPRDIWDGEAELQAEAAELRRKHRESEAAVSLDDFRAYMPTHSYIYTPTRSLWPGASVNARIQPVKLIDENGEPVRNEKGEPVMLSPSAWLH